MATKTLPGRQLGVVKYDTSCPGCQKAVLRGGTGTWYVPKTESLSGKAQVFCSRNHAEAYYGATTASVPEPITIVPEEAPAPCDERHHGWSCTLDTGHEGFHEALDTAGVAKATWSPEGTVVQCVTCEAEPVANTAQADTITINGVEISTKGKHRDFALVLTCAAARGPKGQRVNVLLVGPAGTGKSTLAKQVHEALGLIWGVEELGWCSLSLASDTPSSKLFGYKDANGVFQRTPFYGCYTGDEEPAGTTLIDELDNGSATVVAGLNQALANGEASFANGNGDRHEHATVIATANTYGKGGDRLFVSRQQLDAASLDRFVTITVEYDEELETRLALEAGEGAPTGEIHDLINTVRYARARASEKKLPLVFSPRACIDGALLLAAGVPFQTVLDIRVFAGVARDVRAGLQ